MDHMIYSPVNDIIKDGLHHIRVYPLEVTTICMRSLIRLVSTATLYGQRYIGNGHTCTMEPLPAGLNSEQNSYGLESLLRART